MKEPSKRLAMLWKCLISVGGMCSVDCGVEYLHDCRAGVSFRTEQVPPHSAVQRVCFLPDWARDEVGGGRRY